MVVFFPRFCSSYFYLPFQLLLSFFCLSSSLLSSILLPSVFLPILPSVLLPSVFLPPFYLPSQLPSYFCLPSPTSIFSRQKQPHRQQSPKHNEQTCRSGQNAIECSAVFATNISAQLCGEWEREKWQENLNGIAEPQDKQDGYSKRDHRKQTIQIYSRYSSYTYRESSFPNEGISANVAYVIYPEYVGRKCAGDERQQHSLGRNL